MEKREKNIHDIDEMVAMIEQLMENGSMHVSVKTDEACDGVRINTVSTNECVGGACMQPTEKQELSKLKTIDPEQQEEDE